MDSRGITASGARAQEGVTISAPPSIPFGSKIYIPAALLRIGRESPMMKFATKNNLYSKGGEAAEWLKNNLAILIGKEREKS